MSKLSDQTESASIRRLPNTTEDPVQLWMDDDLATGNARLRMRHMPTGIEVTAQVTAADDTEILKRRLWEELSKKVAHHVEQQK